MRAADPEKDPELRLRVVERGGRPVGRTMMGNTNPGKSRNCFRGKCGVCVTSINMLAGAGAGAGAEDGGGGDTGWRGAGPPLLCVKHHI